MTPEEINEAARTLRTALEAAGFREVEFTDPADAACRKTVVCASFEIDGKTHPISVEVTEV